MWTGTYLLRISFVLALGTLLLTGCTLEETEENIQTVQGYVQTATPYVPATHTYIPIAISALSTAALAIIKILKEKRETQRMKKAIKAKARQLEKVLVAPSNPDPNKEHSLKTFMRADKSKADDETFAALSDFDGVRKGYM